MSSYLRFNGNTYDGETDTTTSGSPDAVKMSASLNGDEYIPRVTILPPAEDVFFGFGEESVSGAGVNADVWGGPTNVQPEPDTVGYSLFFTSDNVADDGSPVGTGARTVGAHYLDTAGVQKTVVVTMDGTTEVDSGVTDCMFVNQSHVVTVGANTVAVGNVDCLAGSAGAVVSRISADGNQSMSTMKQVPAGKTLFVTGWHGYGVAATTKIASLRLRSSVVDGVLSPGVYHFRDSARLKDASSGHIPIQFSCPSLSTIKVSAWTTGTIEVGARWAGYLQDNA
jgi:hypothetical protein